LRDAGYVPASQEERLSVTRLVVAKAEAKIDTLLTEISETGARLAVLSSQALTLSSEQHAEAKALNLKLNTAQAELATQASIYELCADETGLSKPPVQTILMAALTEVTDPRSSAILTGVVQGALSTAREIQQTKSDMVSGRAENADQILIDTALLANPAARGIMASAGWIISEGGAILMSRSGVILARVEGAATELALREATLRPCHAVV
jgi:hypothetical protein